MGRALVWIAFAAGLVVVLATAGSVVRTLVVPRGVSSRLTSVVTGGVRGLFLLASRGVRRYETKDRVLALQGPMSLLALLVTWLLLFLGGFLLAFRPFVPSLTEAFRHSGSAMFTLGFAASAGIGATVLSLAAAATGLVVVALQIAYLPTLYAAFNRRETLVTLLQSRAGSPAWGPEILARHQIVHILDNLPEFYGEWERWAADLAESHSNYPVLLSFRSPHALRSWVLGLLAVADSAALYNALCPATVPSEARLCIRMAFTCLRDIASAVGIPYDADPLPDEPIVLTYDEFLDGVRRLEQVAFPMERSAAEAWPHFRGWRVNYEPLAYALADRVVAAPGPWSGPRRHLPGLMIEPRRPLDRKPGQPASGPVPPGA